MKDTSSDFSRRRFLTTAASGLVSAGIVGFSPGLALAEEKTKKAKKAASEIIYRQLGRSKIKVPIISMGAGAADHPGIVQAAYELGVRHFDTAAYYQFGRNEQMVGSALSRLGVSDQAIIGTKAHTPRQRRGLDAATAKKKIISSCEASLRRLKTDYIDIFYVHDVSDPAEVNGPGIGEAMAALKDRKLIKAAALSTHSRTTEVINEAVAGDIYDVILTSFNFTMADDLELLKAIDNAAQKGTGIIAMKVMAGGGRWPNPESRKDYSGATIASAALKWVMQNKSIATCIPGFNTQEHLNHNFSIASNLEYTDEEKKFLSDNQVKLSFGFCRQCRECLASCPRGVEVPTLMRTHMYAAQYADFHLARATLDNIPSGIGLQSCTLCSECTAQCVRTVDIARRIDELKLMYA